MIFVMLATKNKTEVESYQVLQSKLTPLELYMRDIGYRESGGNHTVTNRFGMLGLYQFSMPTLKSLGYSRSAAEFLQNKHLQDTMMVKYLSSNYKTLKPYIKRYNNKTIKGVRVTTAGVLAAAHLGGPGSVINWFTSDDYEGRTDANGTSVRQYMILFGKHGEVLGSL